MFNTLYDCTIACIQRHGSSVTQAEFIAQLPGAAPYSLNLIKRACAVFNIKIVQHAISAQEISTDTLPAIGQMLDGTYRVIIAAHDTRLTVLDDDGHSLDVERESFATSFNNSVLVFSVPNQRAERIRNRVFKNQAHWFFSLLFGARKLYKPALISSLFINLFALATPLFVMNVYDRVVPNGATATLLTLAIGAGIVFLFDFILKRHRQALIDSAAKRLDILLSSRLFNKALRIPLNVRPDSTGKFANNLRDFDSIRQFLSSTTLVALIDLPFVILFLLTIAFIGGPLVFIPLIFIPIVLGYSWYIQRKAQPVIKIQQELASERHALLVESISNGKTVKHLQTESLQLKEWEEINGEISSMNYASKLMLGSISHFSVFAQQISSIALIAWGVYLIIGLELTVGALIASFMISSRIAAPICQVASLISQAAVTKSAFEALDALMNLPDDSSPNNDRHSDTAFHGDIQLTKIDAKYQDCDSSVLKDISLSIGKGERISLIGRVGSGKSTLLDVLATLHDISDGQLDYSKVNRQHRDLYLLRNQISLVDQYPRLSSGSLRYNLDPTNRVTDEQIFDYLDQLGLAEFVSSNPAGLGMNVGEMGSSLSGGQRQVVAIVRALIRNPKLLLLDEPTSGMDSETEARTIKLLTNLPRTTTLVVATHKPALLNALDRVVVLEKGRVVLDTPQSKFHEMRISSKDRKVKVSSHGETA